VIAICWFVQFYVFVLVARAITSFFPVTPGTAFAQIVDVLYKLTEPILGPVRRVIPPLGMFDMSFLVVMIAIQFLLLPLVC
jgi:YggT family protein